MALFSYEGKASRVFMRIAEATFLNLLWAVCSLPIVTIGASTTALYYVTIRMAENREGDIRQQFFRSFKQNFKQATQLWLILLAIGLFLASDVYILQHLRSSTTGGLAVFWTLVLALVIAVIIAYIVELFFVFPLLASVDNTNSAMLKNSLLIGTHYLNATIVVFAIHFVMLVVVVRFFTPALIMGEGLVALGSSYLLAPVMRAVTTKPAQDASNTTKQADETDERS